MANKVIGHRIIAVPERKQYVDNLLRATGLLQDIVLWDTAHNGCMWNAIRAWESYKEEPRATHWCVMADDTDVVNDYLELEHTCVSNFPDAIWTFYSNELSSKHAGKTAYIKLLGYNIRGIAFILPVKLIDGYVKWCRMMLNKYNYQLDDATCRIYAFLNNVPVMTAIPNLVRSHEIKSSMSGHGITRNSDAWQGYEVDKKLFINPEYKTVRILKKSVLETHLKKDNPVDILIREKWREQNADS